MHKPKMSLDCLFASLVKPLHLQWLQKTSQPQDITYSPTLPLVGHFSPYRQNSITVLGEQEFCFLNSMASITSVALLEQAIGTVAIISSPPSISLSVWKALLEKVNKPIWVCAQESNELVNNLMTVLYPRLAWQCTLHGVFMDIFGKGVLFTGKSGIGKSRLALALLERNHRLIADDAPYFSRLSPFQIMGRCPENLQNLLAPRPLGIINVTTLFGPLCVLEEKPLDLIVHLSSAENALETPIPHLQVGKQKVLNLPIKCLSLPFAFVQNPAILIENAVKMVFNQFQDSIGDRK